METTFGITQIGKKTPLWVKWVCAFFILLTTVATFVIAGDPAIHNDIKVRIGLYLKGADMLILGVSQMFGFKLKDVG